MRTFPDCVDTNNEQRWGRVNVSFDFLIEFMREGNAPDGRPVCTEGVPEDAKFLFAFLPTDMPGTVALMFSHPSFPVGYPGDDVPPIMVRYGITYCTDECLENKWPED